MSDPLPAPLDYAGTSTRPTLPPPWRTNSLRLLLFCWSLPLIFGLVVFLLELPYGRQAPMPLVQAGALNIVIGTGLAGIGGIAVLVFIADRWQRAAGDRWQLVLRPALQACLLLGSNFVVAFVMVWTIAG
jgi:hypothetical protein